GGNATLVDPGLVAAKGGVAGAGKARAEAEVAAGAAGRGGGIMTAVANHDFGAGTIVGGEQDERVVMGTHGLELLKDPADLAVHAINHGRVNRHLGRLKAALLLGQSLPGQGVLHFAGTELFKGVGEVIG